MNQLEMSVSTLAQTIRETVQTELLMGQELTVDSDLFAAGLDSMAIAQLLLSLEERVGIWLDEGLLTRDSLRSCNTLASCVADYLSQRRAVGS